MSRKLFIVFILTTVFIMTIAPNVSGQSAECDYETGVLIGTLTFGINCLDDSGWHQLEITSGTVLDVTSMQEVAACPSGTLHMLHVFGINTFDGSNWTDAPKGDYFAPKSLACGENDELWVAHMQGVAHYDGSAWTNYTEDQFGTSPFIIGVEKVAIGADGSVWAMTSRSAAKFVDGEWQVYENGSGFDQDYTLSDMVVNNEGNPWLTHSSGLLSFDGSSWQSEDSGLLSLQTMAVDTENRIWVGSFTEGVAVYDGENWETFNLENSDIASNEIHSLAVDGQGRVWVGTEWGLSVFNGETWTNFTMDNSDLLDNSVRLVRVMGNGPALPETGDKENGSLVGSVELGADGVPGARVELCTETLGGMFMGETPCEFHPDHQLVTADENGAFVFESVPVGRYEIVIEGPDGWIRFIGVDTGVEIAEGQETDLADIDISE